MKSYRNGNLKWQGWKKELKFWAVDWIKHPHLFFPRKLWLLECTTWVLFGWIIIIFKHTGII